jgi:hypothetical protein
MRRLDVSIMLLFGIGCAPVQPTTAPTATAITVKVPYLTAVERTKENQEIDGIRMMVTPVPFRVAHEAYTGFRSVPMLLVSGPTRPIERRDVVRPMVRPQLLQFKVLITNRLTRVVRLSGSVISVQSGGRSVSIPQSKNIDFLNGIILPQQQIELQINGPDLAEIAGTDLNGLPGDSTTVALLLFDVVTATDAAGNPTRRSNFEFYYRLKMGVQADSAPVITSRWNVGPEAFNAVVMRQQAEGQIWVHVPEIEKATAPPALIAILNARNTVQPTASSLDSPPPPPRAPPAATPASVVPAPPAPAPTNAGRNASASSVAALRMPTLITPGVSVGPGPLVPSLTPTMSWMAVAGATGYAVVIRDVTTNLVVLNTDVGATARFLMVPSGKLVAGHRYRWNVRAKSGATFGPYAGNLFFRT